MWQETWTVANSEFTSSRLKTWESLIAPSNSVIFLLKLVNIRLQKGKTGHFDTKSFWHQLKRWNLPKNFVHESVVCAEQEIYFGYIFFNLWVRDMKLFTTSLKKLVSKRLVSKRLCIKTTLHRNDFVSNWHVSKRLVPNDLYRRLVSQRLCIKSTEVWSKRLDRLLIQKIYVNESQLWV